MTKEPLLDREVEMINQIEEIKANLRDPKISEGKRVNLTKDLTETTSRLLHSFYEGTVAASPEGRGLVACQA